MRYQNLKVYFFSKIFFNFLCWAFIGLGFIAIPMFAEGMGTARMTPPFNGIGGFISTPFVWATAVGYLLMTAVMLILKNVLLRIRRPEAATAKGFHVITDEEAEDMFFGEWLGQINSIANLALVAYALDALDKFLQKGIFTSPALAPNTLITVSVAFYLLGLLIFFAFARSAPEAAVR